MLAPRLRPLPPPPLQQPQTRTRPLPRLLRPRPRPPRPPHPRPHPRRHRLRCQQDEGDEMSRNCRHISESVHLKLRRMVARRWPRKNDAASIRARQEAVGVDGLVTAIDLAPFAGAAEAVTGVAVIPVS